MMIDGIPKLAFLWSKFQSRAFEFLVFNAFFRPNFGCANSMMEELRGNLYPNNMWMGKTMVSLSIFPAKPIDVGLLLVNTFC